MQLVPTVKFLVVRAYCRFWASDWTTNKKKAEIGRSSVGDVVDFAVVTGAIERWMKGFLFLLFCAVGVEQAVPEHPVLIPDQLRFEACYQECVSTK